MEQEKISGESWLERGEHPSADELELFALGRLEESESARLEEHLLVCESCQKGVRETDAFVLALKQAEAQRMSQEEAAGGGSSEFKIPRAAFALAATVCVAAVVGLGPLWQQRQEPQSLTLEAFRGTGVSELAAGKAFELALDTAGLPEADQYQVEIADRQGKSVHQLVATRTGNRLKINKDDGLTGGQYWVRIYTGNQPRILLREFELRVRP